MNVPGRSLFAACWVQLGTPVIVFDGWLKPVWSLDRIDKNTDKVSLAKLVPSIAGKRIALASSDICDFKKTKCTKLQTQNHKVEGYAASHGMQKQKPDTDGHNATSDSLNYLW